MKLTLICLLLLTSTNGFGQAQQSQRSERVDVDNIKEKYWAKGNETELRVVQNRLYSKTGKIELAAFGGFVSTDPFLSVKNAGATLGFHLSEYFGINLIFWKHFVTSSEALKTFERTMGTTTNNNHPDYFYGAELAYSPIYGKLSLSGRAIIYYDMHLSLGGGMTATESGAYPTGFAGIGQQIYISKYWSLLLDYRRTYYREKVVQKVNPGTIGQTLGTRDNWSDVITLGMSVLFDIF